MLTDELAPHVAKGGIQLQLNIIRKQFVVFEKVLNVRTDNALSGSVLSLALVRQIMLRELKAKILIFTSTYTYVRTSV